jgi:alpha-2-macroglobulin
MSKKILLFFFIFFLSISLIAWDFPFFKKKQELSLNFSTYQEPPKEDDSIVRVIEVNPKNDTLLNEPKKEIIVVFNHPMIPLSNLEKETKGIFTISPSVSGNFRWYGSRICAFLPDKDWRLGSSYEIKIPSGIESVNKKRLPKENIFKFKVQIPELTIEDISPIERNYDYSINRSIDTIDYNEELSFEFNFPVDLNEFKKNTILISNGKELSYTLSYFKNSNKQKITVKPNQKFSVAAKVSLEVKKSISPIGLKTSLKADKIFNYDAHGPLTVSMEGSPQYFQTQWGYYLKFSNPIDPSVAISSIKITPSAPLKRKLYGDKTTQVHLSNFFVKPGVKYKVKVSPLKDIYGNKLEKESEFEIEMPNYRPDFQVETGVSVIESKMKQILPVELVNMPTLNLFVGKFDISFIQESLKRSETYERDFLYDDLKYTDVKWNTNSKWNVGGKYGFDLQKYLTKNKTGWFAIRYQDPNDTYDKNSKSAKYPFSQIVQATDLGISVKEGYDYSYVWINSITKGDFLKDIEVKMYDTKNKINSCTTDINGFCKVKNSQGQVLPLSIYTAENKNEDKAFVNSRDYETYIGYHRSYGVMPNFEFYGEVFYDRKLYRPGDTVFFKAILANKKNGQLKPYSNKSIAVSISDSRGKSVFEKTLTSSNEGGIWSKLEIGKDAPLGHYSIRIDSPGLQNVFDSFQVEEFRPVTFSVAISGGKDSIAGEKLNLSINGKYLFGAPMQNAEMRYSINKSIKSISFQRFSDYNFGDSSFYQYQLRNSNYNYDQGNKKLDAVGNFTIPYTLTPMYLYDKIDKPEKNYTLSAPYSVSINATVTDVDTKTVTNQDRFDVYAGNFLIGIQNQNSYQEYKSRFDFNLIAVSNKAENVGTKNVEIRVVKSVWKSILSKSSGSSTSTQNTLTTELVLEQEQTISDIPSKFSFQPTSPGTYLITVQEKSGMVFARTSIEAYGKSDELDSANNDGMSWSKRDDDSVALTADKPIYNPGDIAKILIKSPFEKCKAIITIERETVLWSKTIELTNDGKPIEIPIKEEYLPNVFFSAMLIRPRLEAKSGMSQKEKEAFIKYDLGLPKFKMGTIRIPVNVSSKVLNLSLRTDKENYNPGDLIKVYIDSKPNSEIAMTVADEAVLNLIDYRYKNPVDKFYSEWQNGIRTLENRKLLIKQYSFANKGENPGGGGGDESSGGFDLDSEDGSRKNIKYTAYWNPNIKADSNGKAYVEFKLPDNLTSFRIMAVSSLAGKYGQVAKSFEVKKAMVILQNTSSFIRPGDVLKMGMTLINQTTIKEKFKVSLNSELLIPSNNNSVIELKPGESREVVFPVSLNLKKYGTIKKQIEEKKENRVISLKGNLSVSPQNPDVFKNYRTKDINDKLAFELDIKEPEIEEAFTIAGFTDSQIDESILIPGPTKVNQFIGGLKINLSSSALIGLENGFQFYRINPHQCLEQRSSAFLLSMSAGSLLKSFSYSPPNDEGYNFRNIEKIFLGEMEEFQNADGGFNLWKTSNKYTPYPNPYLTAHTTFILQLAKDNGYSVKESVLTKSYQFLQAYIKTPSKDGYLYVLDTFSLINYLFARQGIENDSLTELLLQNEDKLSMRSRIYLSLSIAKKKGIKNYKENKHTNRIMEYIKNHLEVTTRSIRVREQIAGSSSRAFYSEAAVTGLALLNFLQLDLGNPLIPQMVNAILKDKKNLWADSHSTGIIALALKDYYDRFEKQNSVNPPIAKVSINSKIIAEKAFEKNKLQSADFHIPFYNLGNFGSYDVNYPFQFKNENKSRLYYSASLEYSAILKEIKERDEGIEIQRTIFDLGKLNSKNPLGKIIKNNFTRGNIYLYKITVINPKTYYNAVIQAPIPSSFEIINSEFKTEDQKYTNLVEDKNSNEEYNYWNRGLFKEYKKDKAIFYEDYLYPGKHDYYFLVRPLVKGTAIYPPASAKLMYEPEVFGRTNGTNITVQ